MPVAAIAAVAMAGSAVAGGIAQSSAAKAAAKAQKKSAASNDYANQLNMAMQLAAMGAPVPNIPGVTDAIAGWQASALPYLFGNGTEKGFAQDATQAYNDGRIDFQTFQDIVNSYAPEVAQSDRTVRDLLNGATLEKRINDIQPVLQARTKSAESQIAANNLEITKALNQNRMEMVRGGFVGDSLTRRRLGADLRISGSTTAAKLRGDANLANAVDVFGLKNSDTDSRIANINLPFVQSKNRLAMANAASDAATGNLRNAQAGLEFFKTKMSPSTWQPFNYQPIPTSGQIWGNVAGNVLSNVGQYAMNQSYQTQQANQLKDLMTYQAKLNALDAASQTQQGWSPQFPTVLYPGAY